MIKLYLKRRRLRREYGYQPVPCSLSEKIGIAENAFSSVLPLNGVRLNPGQGTSGWFIWAGEHVGTADDWFMPLCAYHFTEACQLVTPYLELPPGWRFQLAPNHEDVWFDSEVDISP